MPSVASIGNISQLRSSH